MSLSFQRPRGSQVARPQAPARRKDRRAGRLGVEALEARVVMDAAWYVGGLEFLAVGLNQWGGTPTTNEVQIGLKPAGSVAAFKPLLDAPGGLGFTGAATSTLFTTNGPLTTYASKTQTPTTLFAAGHSFKVDSGATAQTISVADAASSAPTDFNLAGTPMTATQLDLGTAPVQVYGSFSLLGGLKFPVTGVNPVKVASPDKVPSTPPVLAVAASPLKIDLPSPPSLSGGGATFALGGVKVGYDPAFKTDRGTGAFYVNGSATATFGTVGAFGVSLVGPTAGHYGLVFDASNLYEVNATVSTTATLKLGGLTVTPKNLSLGYQKGGDFSLAGGLMASVQGGANLGLALNGRGAVIDSSGNLKSISATVDGDIGVSGTFAVSPVGLTFSYDASAKQYKVYGAVNLTVASANFQSVRAKLGDASKPGLQITDGTLDRFDVSMSGDFDIFGVSVTPTDLHVVYDASKPADPVVSVSGKLTARFTSSISIGAGIDDKTPLVIHTKKTGADAVDFSKGFGVSVDGDFKGFTVHAMVTYKPSPTNSTGYDVVAKGSLTTPAGIGFDAYLHIKDKQLIDIGVGVSAKVAVGETGLFITWIYGSLNNLDTDDPTITAAVTLVYGDAHILRVTGAVEINKEHLLLTADKTAPPAIYTSGQVSASDHALGVFILDGSIGQMGGSVDLNWSSGVYRVHAYGDLLDGLAAVDVGMTLTKAGNLSFSADVGIGIPVDIPVIGGLKLATGHVRLEYRNGDMAHSYVAAWGDFFGGLITAGVEYNFGSKDFSYLDAAAVSQLQKGANQDNGGVRAPHVDFYFDVPYDTGSLQFTLSDPYFDHAYPGSGYDPGANYPASSGISGTHYVNVLGPGDSDRYTNGFTLRYSGDGTVPYSPGDAAVPSVDPLQTIAGYTHTARIITILPTAGHRTLKAGQWKFTLQADVDTSPAVPTAKAHFALQPVAPTFGYLFAGGSYNSATYTEAAPVAAKVDADKIDVSIPVDVYNVGNPYTVSLYATDTPLPPGADPSNPVAVLDASGKPALMSATLVERHQENASGSSIDPNDSHHGHYVYDTTVLASQFGKLPDGHTPAYFYAVVSDGINHPHFSVASNAVTLNSPAPVVSNSPDYVVTDFKQPIDLNMSVSHATSLQIVSGDGTFLFPRAGGYGTPEDLALAEDQGDVYYIPPAAGIPPSGADTITITALNQFPGEAKPYVTAQVIRLLPPTNVDLSVSQYVYNNGNYDTLASTTDSSVSGRPVTEGENVTFLLTAKAAATPAGGAPVARGVKVNFPIPAGFTFVSATTTGAYDPTTGIWQVGDLAPSIYVARYLFVTARVNAGTAGKVLTATATALPGANSDGTPQTDISLTNVRSTANFYVGLPIAGQVRLVDNRPGSADKSPRPAAGLTVYQIVANAADTAEYVVGSAVTDADGRYGFPVRTNATYPVVHVRVYALNDTSQTLDDYTPGTAPTFHVTTVQPATVGGKLQHERFPSFPGDTGTAPGFSAKSGGLVYLDLNNDDVWQLSEPSVATGADGRFSFPYLVPGSYTVRELVKPGRVATGSNAAPYSDARAVRVVPGATDNSSSFYYVDQITLQGHAFVDSNSDGVFDPGEPGLAGWTYDLDHYLGSRSSYSDTNYYYGWRTSVTDAAGKFHFDNLPAGIYRLRQRVVDHPGGPWNATVSGAGVAPYGYIEVTSGGDVLLDKVINGALVSQRDTRANHLSHIDFGNVAVQRVASFARSLAVRSADLTPAAAGDTLVVTAPADLQAGEVGNFTVTAIGPDGKPDPNFTGKVNLASSDDSALLSDSYTFLPGDQGSHTFGVSLMSVGTATINASLDGAAGVDAASPPIEVHAGAAVDCIVTAPESITPGKSYTLELNPVDRAGDTDPNYWGDAQIRTSLAVDGAVIDPSTLPAAAQAWLVSRAGLPSSYHFTLNDKGDHTFQITAPPLDAATIAAIPGMGGASPGKLSLVVGITDPAGEIAPADVSVPIAVSTPASPTPTPTLTPTPMSTIAVTFQGPTDALVGVPSAMTVVAAASAGGATIDRPYLVHFVSSDPGASLPPDTVFAPGAAQRSLVVRFATPGAQTITAVDAATGAVVGASTVAVQARLAPAVGMVGAIYQTLLGHPADPQALAAGEARLAKGTTPGRLALSVSRGREYAEAQVNEVYRDLLGRAPSPAERNLAVARLRRRGSLQGIEQVLLGSGEYNRLHGGQAAGFLGALGNDIFGRQLTSRERSHAAAQLNRGSSRASVAGSLLNTPAALRARAVRLYEEVLSRAPSPTEAAHAAVSLKFPAGRAATLVRMFDSAEFRTIATGQAAPAPVTVSLVARPRWQGQTTVAAGRALPAAARFRIATAR